MKINIYLNENEVNEKACKGLIVIESFIPSDSDEKSILIKGLEQVIALIQVKF